MTTFCVRSPPATTAPHFRALNVPVPTITRYLSDMASSTFKMPSLMPHHHLHHSSHPYRRRNALPDIYAGLQAASAMEHLRGLYTAERLGLAAAVAVAVAQGGGSRRPSRTADPMSGLSRQVEGLSVSGPSGPTPAAAHCAIGGC